MQRIRNHPAVRDIEDDGGCCDNEHNWIVSLRDGYVDVENDCMGGLAEYTLTKIWYRLNHYVKHTSQLTEKQRQWAGV
jgi:hypothetical protein